MDDFEILLWEMNAYTSENLKTLWYFYDFLWEVLHDGTFDDQKVKDVMSWEDYVHLTTLYSNVVFQYMRLYQVSFITTEHLRNIVKITVFCYVFEDAMYSLQSVSSKQIDTYMHSWDKLMIIGKN
jgi:hypothetical protein